MPSLLFFLTATTLGQNFIIFCLGTCNSLITHLSPWLPDSLTPCLQLVLHIANQIIFLESILDHVTHLLRISQQLPPTYRIKTECVCGAHRAQPTCPAAAPSTMSYMCFIPQQCWTTTVSFCMVPSACHVLPSPACLKNTCLFFEFQLRSFFHKAFPIPLLPSESHKFHHGTFYTELQSPVNMSIE